MERKEEEDVIVFDNLVQADTQLLGSVQPVKAVLSGDNVEPFAQPNASGELYRPSNLEDVKNRATEAGRRFVELFQS